MAEASRVGSFRAIAVLRCRANDPSTTPEIVEPLQPSVLSEIQAILRTGCELREAQGDPTFHVSVEAVRPGGGLRHEPLRELYRCFQCDATRVEAIDTLWDAARSRHVCRHCHQPVVPQGIARMPALDEDTWEELPYIDEHAPRAFHVM